MDEPGETSVRIRQLLDRLVDSEGHSNEEREAVWDEVATAARSLPRDGVLEALDRAVGRSRERLRQAVYILAELADVPEAAERIVAGLEDPDPRWRSWLIQTVEQRSIPHCGAALARIIAGDPDAFCRQVAIHAAGTLRLRECLPAILALAVEGSHASAVAWALKDYATEECRPQLARYFEPGNPKHLRVVGAWGLARLKDSVALSYLVEMLDDPDESGEKFFRPGQSLRAAQAVSDIHGWPFTWGKAHVARTKERLAGQRPPE
jgi:HEAT repeat protein